MNIIIRSLLAAHRRADKLGLFEFAPLRRLLIPSYFIFKRCYDGGLPNFARRHADILAAGNVLDVGANIGFTSVAFASVVAEPFKVFAFEPEALNYERLCGCIADYGAVGRIVPLRLAVGNTVGQAVLRINRANPSDHRLGSTNSPSQEAAETQEVQITTIDEFVEKTVAGPISFIKLDIQGAEGFACEGMQKTLRGSDSIVVAFEFSPASLADFDFSPEKLLSFFEGLGFGLYRLRRNGRVTRTSVALLLQQITGDQYVDLIASRRELE